MATSVTTAVTTKGMVWHEDIRTLTTFASDIHLAPGQWPERVYLRSHKTNKVVTFYRNKLVTNGDNELVLGEYGNYGLKVTLRVYND